MPLVLAKYSAVGTHQLSVVDTSELARLLVLLTEIGCFCFVLFGESASAFSEYLLPLLSDRLKHDHVLGHLGWFFAEYMRFAAWTEWVPVDGAGKHIASLLNGISEAFFAVGVAALGDDPGHSLELVEVPVAEAALKLHI